MEDTAKVSDLFVFECHQAGLQACAFWEPTVEGIAQKLERLFDTVPQKPVAVFNSGTDYGIIDRDAIRMVMFKLLKGPYSWFQPMAQGLQDLVNGDGTWALQMFKRLVRGDFECPSCHSPDPSESEVLDDGGTAIHCNDYEQIEDAESWSKEYYAQMMNGSKWGDIWSRYLLYCQYVCLLLCFVLVLTFNLGTGLGSPRVLSETPSMLRQATPFCFWRIG